MYRAFWAFIAHRAITDPPLSQGKFVHLIRDGRACAWSMSHHFAFRFMIAMQTLIAASVPPDSVSREGEGERGGNEQQQPQGLAQIDFKQIVSRPIPLQAFGSFWSQAINTVVQALSVLPEEQILTIRYEDIVTDPEHNLARLLDFIDPSLHDVGWLARACTLVEHRPSSWDQVLAAEREALERACQPGQAVLDLVVQEEMHSPKPPALLQHVAGAPVVRESLRENDEQGFLHIFGEG